MKNNWDSKAPCDISILTNPLSLCSTTHRRLTAKRDEDTFSFLSNISRKIDVSHFFSLFRC